jgi:hypothetical protein
VPQGSRLGGLGPTHLVASMVAFALWGVGSDVRKRATRGEARRDATAQRKHGGETRLLERSEREDRIERKTRLLEELDSKREVELEGTFTKHVADAIRASSPIERQQEIDNATEAYEDALDQVLYKILDKHFADEDSSIA